MEGAIPGITDDIGYGVELSLRFKNVGAPRYYFTEDQMTINYNAIIEYYDKDFNNLIASITYNDLTIDFNMYLEDFTLKFDYNSISLGSAHVESSVVTNLKEADTTVENYFKYAFMVIIPWANTYHPDGFSSFQIPREIPDFMKIDDISMAIK